MIWIYTLGDLKYYIIGVFALTYLLYIFRLGFIIKGPVKFEIFNLLKKIILRVAYFILILMSLMGPSFGDVKKELKSVGKDIYLLIDVSASMNAFDIPPSRLEKVKKELHYMIKNLNFNDKIGIIVFTAEGYLQCPLTYDIEAVELYLQTIKSDYLPTAGSHLENALAFTASKFPASKNAAGSDRYVILASDGEDNDSDIRSISNKLKKQNIVVFTIGVGTREGSKIPEHPGFKKDKNNNYVLSRLEKNTLMTISSATGGGYYEVNDKESQIGLLLEELNKIQGRVKEIKKIEISSNKYYYFLALGLLLVIIDGVVTLNIVRL